MNNAVKMLEEIELLEKTRTNPVWFAEEVLNLTGEKYFLDEWQKELLDGVADVYRKQIGLPTVINHDGKSMITVRAMHGPGKTFIVAAIMHWFNCAFKGRIICTAPKEAQLRTRLWPAFRKIGARAGREYSAPIKTDSTKIVWHGDEDWCALAETASQPENLAGYHDDYMLFIVDEASGVNEAMFPVIEGAISTGTIVILLLIGNPTKNQGTFHASHCVPKVAKHYHQIHVDLAKTTRVNKDWVKRMEDKYGKDSPVVKIRCYGEFADTDVAQLISYSWVTDAMERESRADGSPSKLRITVDVADGGEDFTEVTAARMYDSGTDVIEQREFNFPSSESPVLAADAAEALFRAHGGSAVNGDDIVVDSLGVGAGTAGILMKRGYNVVTYKGGAGSDDSTKYRNRRTQSYICMRDAHRDGTIAYLEGFTGVDEVDEFTAQMCSVKTKPGSERLEELETKESMKRRSLKSPDKSDGIAMFYATQAPSVVTQMEVSGMGEMESSRSDW
jgi:phage terminase large subunit